MKCPNCCSLKQAFLTIGFWSLLFSLCQCALFAWQSYLLLDQKDTVLIEKRKEISPFVRRLETQHDTAKQAFYFVLLITHIIIVVVSICLFLTSAAFIHAVRGINIQTVLSPKGAYIQLVASPWNSKFLLWPWFFCTGICIFCSVVYCILCWSTTVHTYWFILAFFEMVTAGVNVIALIYMANEYRRI